MNKDYYLLASLVHTVINEKIINISVMTNKNYYGKRKIDETIQDVNDYLNFLSIENIYSEVIGMDNVNTCEDIINELISGFTTNFLSVECKVPSKYNFEVYGVLHEKEVTKICNEISSLTYIALFIILLTLALSINYLLNN